jgi:hypothetical protein
MKFLRYLSALPLAGACLSSALGAIKWNSTAVNNGISTATVSAETGEVIFLPESVFNFTESVIIGNKKRAFRGIGLDSDGLLSQKILVSEVVFI